MELISGYKLTDCGIIPNEWNVRSVREIAEVKTGPFGSALHEKDYVFQGTPIITVEHIRDYRINQTNVPMVSDNDRDRLKTYCLRQGDIVFSRVGAIDRNALITSQEEGWLFSGRLLRVRIIDRNINPTYLSYHLNTEEFKKKVKTFAVGQTMASINTKILSDITTIIPPFREQQAIAEVLSDMDALIESLEQLIAKKRQIKQGVMQELFEPKKNWIEKVLGKTANLKARIGWQGLTTKEYLSSGNYFLVTGTDFKDGYIDWANCNYVNEWRYLQDRNIQLREQDILLTKDGTIGKIAIINSLQKPATLNSGVFVIRPLENAFHPNFFYYLLLSNIFGKFLNQLSAGSTINHLYQKDLVGFTYKTPPTIDEQIAISSVLCDMDIEIMTVEAKLRKIHQIKQGMMQELLTGKIRLL